jgi:cytochrome c
MIIRLSTVLSVASLIGAFAGTPGAAGEWATKEEAIALVKRAVVVITERGPEKAYAEITKRFHDRDLYIPSSISMVKSSLTAKGGISSAGT